MWTKEWPTTPGWYWFHGVHSTPWGTEKNKTTPVEVRIGGSGKSKFLMYVSNGAFMWEKEGAKGLWQPMPLPALPTSDTCPGTGKCHGDDLWCDLCGSFILSPREYEKKRPTICHLPDCEHHPVKEYLYFKYPRGSNHEHEPAL